MSRNALSNVNTMKTTILKQKIEKDFTFFSVLDNPNEPGYRLLNRGWSQGGNTWKFQGRFEKNLRNREVKDWSFVVQFPSAVDDIDVSSHVVFHQTVSKLTKQIYFIITRKNVATRRHLFFAESTS